MAAAGGDEDVAAHGPSGEVHRPRVLVRERLLMGRGAHAHHEVVVDYAACHLVVEHEREPAEHVLFAEHEAAVQGLLGDHVADPCDQVLVDGHLKPSACGDALFRRAPSSHRGTP